MSVFQAALIALLYAFARSAFSAGLGNYVFAQPLVAGTLAGLILGDPIRGAAIGAGLNLATLGLSALRARFGPDLALIGYVGVPIILFAGAKPDSPQSLAVLGGLAAVGLVISFLAGGFNTILAHWADYFAERGDARVVAFVNIAPSQVFLFVITFFPALLLLLTPETQIVAAWATRVPDWATFAMQLLQRLLTLLGLAMSLRALATGSAIAYVGLGWIAAQLSFDGNAVARIAPIVILGAAISLIHAFISRRAPATEGLAGEPAADIDMDEVPLLPGKTAGTPPVALTSTFLLWQFFGGASANFERGQNIGLTAALSPVLQAIYPDNARMAQALRRNLRYFATEPVAGAGLVGALAAAEARYAIDGRPDADAELTAAKTAAMALTGAAGDALIGGLATAVLIALGAGLALKGSLLGPLLFVVLESALVLGAAWMFFQAGHRWGHRAMAWAGGHAWLRAGGFAAVRLGAFILGALIVRLAPLGFDTATVQIEGVRVALQPYLDAFVPRLIPLGLTLWMWWRLRSGASSPATLCGLCAAGALIITGLMKALGWL